MAPFAHHNGVLSSNFGRDSDLEIRFADEDDRFRDKPRGYYEEHEQKLLSGPEPERTTFQPETRIAIDQTTTQDEVTGPSCPSSPQPYEMTEEGFPTISPENSQLWKICECNADLIETFATVMEEIQDLIEIPDGEEHATAKQQLEEEMREWQAMREEEARKDEEVRRLISEWEEHNKRKEEEIRRWTNTAQETLEKQADREEAHKMTREKKGKMIPDDISRNRMEIEEQLEIHRREHIKAIRTLQQEFEHSLNEVTEQIRNTRLQTEAKEREMLTQIREELHRNEENITKHVKDTTENLYTLTARDARIIMQKLIDTAGRTERTERQIREDIHKLGPEMKTWIYEHITREIKGLSAWLTKQLQEMKEEESSGRETIGRRVYEAISRDVNITQQALMENIRREKQEMKNWNEWQARKEQEEIRTYLQEVANFIQRVIEEGNARTQKDVKTLIEDLRTEWSTKQIKEDQEKNAQAQEEGRRIESVIKAIKEEQEKTRAMVLEIKNHVETVRNQLYERLSQELRGSLQRLEENNRAENETTRRAIMEQNSDKNPQEENENPNQGHRVRPRRKPYQTTRGKEQEPEEEEENGESEEEQNTLTNPIKKKLIAALQEPDDIRTAIKINKIRERAQGNGQHINENMPILDALSTTDSALWPIPGQNCNICDLHITPTQKEKHWRETHGKEMKDELIECAEKLSGTEIEECDRITIGERQSDIVRSVHRCHYIGCSYESTNYVNTLAHRRKHEGWARRVTVLGAFWGRIKQEMELTEQPDNLPTLRELMGETIEYRCTCGVGSYSYEKLQKHREQKRHYGNIIKREIGFRKVQEEERQEITGTVTWENPNQDQVGEEVEQEMREERQGRIDLEEAIQQGERTRTEFLTRTLSQRDLRKAARTFINLRHRQKREQEQTALTLDSPITEVLLNLGITEFPPIHKMKFCPHCCHLFPDQHTLQQHLETIQERDNDTFTEDIKRILVERKLGKVKQIATTLLGVQLEQRGSVHRCRCPGCNYISTDKRKTDLHLERAKDKDHLLFIEETRECGEIFAFIRGYIRLKGRIPTVRQFLGDYDAPQKMCNLCGEFITSNTTEKHGQQNHPERWRQLSIEEKTQIVKISFTLKEALDQTEIERQREHIFMDGDRRIREEAMDRIYAHLMRQDAEEEMRREAQMTEHIHQTQPEPLEAEEQRPQQETSEIPNEQPEETTAKENEKGRVVIEREVERATQDEIPETENEEPERITVTQIEVEGQTDQEERTEEETPSARTETPHETEGNPETQEEEQEELQDETQQILNYLMSDADPEEIERQFFELVEQNGREERWEPNMEVAKSLHTLDRRIMTKRSYTCLECEKQLKNEQSLFTHMTKEHQIPRTDWFVLALAKATHRTAHIVTTDGNNQRKEHEISICHAPGCNFLQTSKDGIKVHVKRKHKELEEDIVKWGVILGTIRSHLRENPKVTWNDILKPRETYQCECGGVFQDEASMSKHFSMVHSSRTKSGWRANYKPVTLEVVLTPEQERDTRREDEPEQDSENEQSDENTPNPTQITAEQNPRQEQRSQEENPSSSRA